MWSYLLPSVLVMDVRGKGGGASWGPSSASVSAFNEAEERLWGWGRETGVGSLCFRLWTLLDHL